MTAKILAVLSSWIIGVISGLGYPGIVLLMALESANIPIPSEIVLPFGGFLAAKGDFNFHLAVWSGVLGQMLGSNLSFLLGFWGGRPFLLRWGKFFFISESDLERAERWFKRFGNFSVFLSRLLPIVRTFISFPAGILKMNLFHFNLYTVLGVIPWSYLLVFVGFKLGESWEKIREFFRGFEGLVLAIIVIGIGIWLFKHLRKNKIRNSKHEIRNKF